jgi:hypothetical protein
VIHDKRFMPIAEAPVSEAVHQPIGERIQRLVGVRLRDASASTAGGRKWRDRDVDGTGKIAVRRCSEVHMKPRKVEAVRAKVEEQAWRTAEGAMLPSKSAGNTPPKLEVS